MISPGERFNAFSTNRLIKKEENVIFGNNQKLVLSPIKHSFFLFLHLLNRSITNIPWIFWVTIVISFMQLAIAVLVPFNDIHWSKYPELKMMLYVLQIIARFLPLDVPMSANYILFAIYSVFVIMHFVLFISIILLIKNKKDINTLLKIFFFYSYLILPIFRCSIICVVSEIVSLIVRKPSFATFVLSLVALLILLLHLFMCGVVQFAMGSSPNPNLVNPLAIWAPCTWRSVHYELYSCVIFIYLEFIRSIDDPLIFVIIISLFTLFSIPNAIYQSKRTYYISYIAYEYIGTILWSIIAFSVVNIIIALMDLFHNNNNNNESLVVPIPFYAVIIIWLSIPFIGFVIIRAIMSLRLRRLFKALDNCGSSTTTLISDNNDQGEERDGNNGEEYGEDHQHASSVYDSLGIKTEVQAISALRAACIVNHPTFLDLSLLQYCLDSFPEGIFYFLHLAFLIQNQTQYVQNLIDLFLENLQNRQSRPNLLQSCVLFQIITSISESSSDLPQQLVRELSRQKLLAMKCQQLLSKFWTSCYKGDINAMGRHAFTMNRNIDHLTKSWKLLVLRYPFSTPVLKDYVTFLSTIGAQHKVVEAILTNRPQLGNEMTCSNTMSNEQQDLNMPILHQAIESAVDRRPINSTKKVAFSLVTSVAIALVFFIVIVVASFVLIGIYDDNDLFIEESEKFTIYFSDVMNLFDDIVYFKDDYSTRSKLFKTTGYLNNALNSMLRYIPSEIFSSGMEMKYELYSRMELYNATIKTDLMDVLKMVSYLAHSLSFVPKNDEVPSIFSKNMIETIVNLNETVLLYINKIERTINTLKRYSPIFYTLNWALVMLLMIPLLYFSIKSLKEEMTYLFSIYLTVPRSTMMRFVEMFGGIGGGKGQDKKNLALLMSTSYAHHTTTSFHDEEENENKQNMNVADSFKMLVSDSSANISVLPKNFVPKAVIIFSFLCGIIALLSTIGCVLFISFSGSLSKCFYTQRTVAERSILSSIIMHGITSIGTDVNATYIQKLLLRVSELNTAILFKDPQYKLSEEALSNSEMYRLQSNERCNNQSDFHCRSMVSLFEHFSNNAANITVALLNGTTPGTNDEKIMNLRRVYNDELHPLMDDMQTELNSYVKNVIKSFQTQILIISFVSIFAIVVIFLLFVLPIINEINATIDAVKLPLKHIPPLEIADMQKVLMYLQGESDFKSGGQNDKEKEAQGGNSVLNVMLCPFAIFEDDLSLLFANSAFYTLLGTSREAAIGLPISDIFSSCMSFKNEESHPFNSLLDTITQLQRGVSPVNVVEIRTELEMLKQISKPVMIRLIGISSTKTQNPSANEEYDENNNNNHNHNNNTNRQNLKASSFALFINDLSNKKALEEKMKYEAEISQKMLDSSIPKSLMNILRNNSAIVVPKTLQKKPQISKFCANDENNNNLNNITNINSNLNSNINSNINSNNSDRGSENICNSNIENNSNTTTTTANSNNGGQQNEQLSPQKFEKVPMVAFTIKFKSTEEEYDDEFMLACSLFLRTAADVNSNLPSALKLKHDPPQWIYTAGIDSQQLLEYSNENNNSNNNGNNNNKDGNRNNNTYNDIITGYLNDLVLFAISVIEVFTASSTTNYVLGAVVHVGSLSIVPMMLELPIIEAFGKGYVKLKQTAQNQGKPEMVLCTPEVEELLADQKNFILCKPENQTDGLCCVKRGIDTSRSDDVF